MVLRAGCAECVPLLIRSGTEPIVKSVGVFGNEERGRPKEQLDMVELLCMMEGITCDSAASRCADIFSSKVVTGLSSCLRKSSMSTAVV